MPSPLLGRVLEVWFSKRVKHLLRLYWISSAVSKRRPFTMLLGRETRVLRELVERVHCRHEASNCPRGQFRAKPWACSWSRCGPISPSSVVEMLSSSTAKSVAWSPGRRPMSRPQWWPSTWRLGHPGHADGDLDRFRYRVPSDRGSAARARTLLKWGACSDQTLGLPAQQCR